MIDVCWVIISSSKAAAPTTILNVEPEAYSPEITLLNSGYAGSASNCSYAANQSLLRKGQYHIQGNSPLQEQIHLLGS